MSLEIQSHITGGILQVAEYDFSEEITFKEAHQVCKDLGNGWRLPNSGELELIYESLHRKGKGNFKETCYWESSGRKFNFANGRLAPQVKKQRFLGVYYPPAKARVRAVLTLPKPSIFARLLRW